MRVGRPRSPAELFFEERPQSSFPNPSLSLKLNEPDGELKQELNQRSDVKQTTLQE